MYSRHSHSTQSQQSAPLVLLQQIQGGGGLLILNSQPYHNQQSQQKQQGRKQHSQQVEVQEQGNEPPVIQPVNAEGKHHQTSTEEKVKSEEESERANVQSLQISGNNSGMNDFSETLNMSQEDIQSTLFANLIPSSPSAENM